MNIEKMPRAVLEALHSRKFSDDEIAAMTADQAFDECCEWEGLIGWGQTLRRWFIELKKAEKQP